MICIVCVHNVTCSDILKLFSMLLYFVISNDGGINVCEFSINVKPSRLSCVCS